MQGKGKAALMRIYTDERAKADGGPLYQAVVERARQAGLAESVLERIDGDRHEVAFLDLEFTPVAVELLDRYVAFRLQAGIDDHVVVVHADHFCGDDLALAHFLPLEGFLEQRGETLFLDGCFCDSSTH